MQNTIKYKLIIAALILVLLILGQKYKGSQQENTRLKDRNEILSSRLIDYSYALDEANDNIDQANSIIDEAQWYAWSSYEEMGYALENLETIDTVSKP